MNHFLESGELWARLEPALDRVLELDAAGQTVFLESIRETDPALFRAVAAMLHREPAFLVAGAGAVAGTLFGSEPRPAPFATGDEVGPYRIVQAIGEGGMGVVYHAERADGAFQMPVALKVIRTGPGGSAKLADRLVAERKILARLAHPGIARLIDGGVTEDGRPYYAMELVDGVPLVTFALERRLPLADRLALFLKVAEAVQYAHENLVIHRDLKPANILITPDRQVKLLDFGVAKLLAGEGEGVTAPATLLLTPSYASPEQLQGELVSTASDVYSLGVILYELLTGRRPLDLGPIPPHRWAEAQAQERIDPPSMVADGLDRAIPPDLDLIAATALRFSPAGRYRTVAAFAADVRRLLAGEPISARPATWRFVAPMFWQRHRVPVVLGAVAAAVSVGFIVDPVTQSRRIRREAALALAERDRTERVNDYLISLFGQLYPYGRSDGIPTPGRMLDSASALLDREFADEPARQADLFEEISYAYSGIGDFAGAQRAGARAVAVQRARPVPDSGALASELLTLGQALSYPGTGSDGEAELRESVRIRERVLGDTSYYLARSYGALAIHLARRGQLAEAESLEVRALRIDSTRADPDDAMLAQDYRNLGHISRFGGRFETALDLYDRALGLLRAVRGDNNAEVGNGFINRGLALSALGRHDEAVAEIEHGLGIRIRLLGRRHDDVAPDLANYAEALLAAGRLGAADSVAAEAVAALRPGPPRSLNLAFALRVHGQARLRLGDRRTGCRLLLEQEAIIAQNNGLSESLRIAATAAARGCR
ncbi:MAG: protein kinase [Gemmatimonadales bacterium]